MMVTSSFWKKRRLWALPKPGRFVEYLRAQLYAPPMDRSTVEALMRAYGLDLVQAPENLPFGWRNDHVVVHTDAGRKVLKRYRQNWPVTTIAHEHAILEQLRRRSFRAPRLVHTTEQTTILEHDCAHFALTDFLEGRNVAASFLLPSQRAQLLALAGQTLARLHQQLRDFVPDQAHHLGFVSASDERRRDLSWHLEMLDDLSRRAGEIEDRAAREDALWLSDHAPAVGRRLKHLDESLNGAMLPVTIIHGDYGIHNLHFHQSGGTSPEMGVTVIDFELARREWRLVDIVAVLSRIGLQDGKIFFRAYQAACNQYLPITDDEWRFLADVWEMYRLRGAIQYWYTFDQQGGRRRLAAARERIKEAERVSQQRPELWDLRSSPAAYGGQRPLRIMMVARLFYPWVGGAERQAHKLAMALTDRRLSVDLATGWWFRNTPQQETVDGIPVHRNFTMWHSFDIKGLRKFSGYLYILTLIFHLWRNRHRYDLIHVHGLNYHTFAAVLAGRLTGRKVLVKLANSGEASDIKKMREGRQLALARFMLPTALQSDCFVALNSTIVQELKDAGVPANKIVTLPNGVDVEAITPKEDYELHEPACILYVGRLHAQKGLDILLRAFGRLCRQQHDMRLVLRLVGDGPLRGSLETLVAQLGLQNRVDFTGLRDDVLQELQQADVFVLPSRAEGLSNALLEAMTCGLPVVVSDIPGNREVIADHVNGLRFMVDDVDCLADSLAELLSQRDLRRQLGCAARHTVERHYSLSDVATRYERLYKALLGHEQVGVVRYDKQGTV